MKVGTPKASTRATFKRTAFTQDWNSLLKAGVVAHGVVTSLVGMLFLQAAWRANPDRAGGIGRTFSWLVNQPYGQVLVAAICIGVNAGYRVVPKVSGGDIETLAARLSLKVKQAT